MEYLLFIAIVLALVEYRKYQGTKEFRDVQEMMKSHCSLVTRAMESQRKETAEKVETLRLTILPLEEFIKQAHSDLGAIVKEQGTQERMKLQEVQYDTVEGL